MKKRLKAFSRTTIALLTAALVCSPFTKAYADDTVDSLEKQTNGLQNQLDSLNQETMIKKNGGNYERFKS